MVRRTLGGISLSQQLKLVIVGMLWTASVGLLAVGAYEGHPAAVNGWAIVAALGATTFAGWHIVTRERLRVERLAEIFAEATDRVEQMPRRIH